MNERLKEIRAYYNLTMEQFGARIGVTKASISRLEKGINSITDQMCKSICREFDIDEEWFRTGSGSMRKELNDNEKIAKFMGQVLRDEPDHIRKRVLSFLSDLTPDDWEDLARIATRHKKKPEE